PAASAPDEVVAPAAGDVVTAATAHQPVVAGPTVQDRPVRRRGDRVVAPAARGDHDRGRRRVVALRHDHVVPRAALEHDLREGPDGIGVTVAVQVDSAEGAKAEAIRPGGAEHVDGAGTEIPEGDLRA